MNDNRTGLNEVRDLAAGFVLAGGESTRMGRDKALVQFAGGPLILHALELLRNAGLEPSIAGARSPLDAYAPLVPDATPGRGPLGGICAGLASTSAERGVFLSVDLPLLPPSLIAYLLFHASISGRVVTLVSVNGFPQTFPAAIRRDALGVLTAELEAGRAGCFSAFRQAAAAFGQPVSILPLEALAQSGLVTHPDALSPAFWFLNVNSSAELARAERLVAAPIR